MKVLTMLTILVTVIAAVNAMYSNPFTWAMHRFYQYRGMDKGQDRHGSTDNYHGQNTFQERFVLQGYPNEYRSMSRKHQDQCHFHQCWDEFFMRRWGQGVGGHGNQDGEQRNGFQNYEECSEGVSRLRQCLQQQLNSGGGCGCEYRDMMWAVRTAKDSEGMATYAFCDDFYNDYTDRQCKDEQYRRCVQTVQRLSFAENRYRCDLRDDVSFAKQCINKYKGQSQTPSGCGNFNWFRYMDPAMEQVWRAELNGCPVYEIGKQCMNPLHEYFACSNQKDRVMNEYDQCVQKFSNQDGRCSPMREARKAMQQFMRFMLEQHCQADKRVKERFQQCCRNNHEEKKNLSSGGNSNSSQNRNDNMNGQRFEEDKKSKKPEEKKEEKKYSNKSGHGREGNYEGMNGEEKKNEFSSNGSQQTKQNDYNQHDFRSNRDNNNQYDNNRNNNNRHDNQNGSIRDDQNGHNRSGFEDRDKKSKGNSSSNDESKFSELKKEDDKKTYNELEDRKTKGGRHGNNNRYSERGNYENYQQQDGEGRLAYLARIIKSWRDSQS